MPAALLNQRRRIDAELLCLLPQLVPHDSTSGCSIWTALVLPVGRVSTTCARLSRRCSAGRRARERLAAPGATNEALKSIMAEAYLESSHITRRCTDDQRNADMPQVRMALVADCRTPGTVSVLRSRKYWSREAPSNRLHRHRLNPLRSARPKNTLWPVNPFRAIPDTNPIRTLSTCSASGRCTSFVCRR